MMKEDNMKAKQIGTLILALLLAAALLAGCGSTGTQTTASGNTGNSGSTASTGNSSTGSDEIYNIEMQIVTWGNAPDEIAQVEEAINAITVPEIGATVTLDAIPAWELINDSNLKLTSGEKIDLMCVFTFGQGMDSLANYTSKNMLRPLGELYEQYGKDIAPVLGEEINLGYVGDTLYAIPCKATVGAGYGFAARTDYLDELGIHPDPDKIYTPDELAEVFQAYVDKAGAGHYALALFGAGTDLYQYLYPLETLGGTGTNGVLMNAGLDGNTTVVNLFETQEYKDYCKVVKGWFDRGFINPDVNTIADDVTSQLKSGNYLGMISFAYPGSMAGMINSVGVNFEMFYTVAPFASTTIASQALWTIPTTCQNPEKVMQFLNLLYQERELKEDIDSMLAAGLEGVSYNVTESLGGSKAIVDIAGVSGTWNTWTAGAIMGNPYTVPKMLPNEASIYEELPAFDQSILDAGRITDAFGYVFDPSAVSTQVAAVTSVVSQYRGLIGYGAMDAEQVLPEFLAALKDAGIDDIIAANQRQLDIWVAARRAG